MSESIRLQGLAGKIETTYMTDIVPTAADDAIQVEDTFWNSIEIGYLEQNLRENAAGYGMGRAGSAAMSGRYGHITTQVALKGASGAFSASGDLEADVPLRTSGLQATVDTTTASETVTYTPRSSSFESGSYYAWAAGSVFKLVGCFSYLTEITFTPNQLVLATFDIWGVLLTDPADEALPTFTYDEISLTPPHVVDAGLTLNSYDLEDFTNCRFEMRTTMVPKPRGNQAYGHAGYEITNWNPHLMVTMDPPARSSLNLEDLMDAGTLFAWDLGIGSTQYNQIALSGSKGKAIGVTRSDQESLALQEAEIMLQNDSGDDAFSLVFS